MSWLSKLTSGLSKSSSKLSDGIGAVFTKRKLDDEALEELEEILIMADMGAVTASDIVEQLRAQRFDKEVTDAEIKTALAEIIAEKLASVAQPLPIPQQSPTVVLVVGVNGNGKTTTIGKVAAQYQSQGKKVMLAAADTFRAAAVEQLQRWGERTGCEVITGADQADPASVAFTAVERAKAESVDVLLIDTAGRLHNKSNLMDELKKIERVIRKADEDAPHHVLQVLDATTGQNAVLQVEAFQDLVNVDALVVTKLDGTAKAGIVVALAEKFGLPIVSIGVGEAVDDLQPFEPHAFAERLVGIEKE